MSEPRQIAIVRDYAELHAALRARADELALSREALDRISGLQNGYAGKLFAPVPLKTLGLISLGPILAAMGVALVLIEDAEMLARYMQRFGDTKQKSRYAGRKMLATRKRKRHTFPKGPAFAKLMRSRQLAQQERGERRRIARKAARARWKGKGGARLLSKGAPQVRQREETTAGGLVVEP